MPDPVELFLSNFPEEVRAIIKELRSVARGAMRGAHEFLYYDAINYSLDDSPLRRICYIAPTQRHVTVGFLFGALLDDKHHLLEGSGKRARHLKVKTLEEARNPAIKELVREAWTRGADPLPKTEQRMRQPTVAHNRAKWLRLSRHFSHAGRG